MARKVVSITIEDDNRDKDKMFILTEMPASRAEKWAWRAMCAITKHSPDIIPDDMARAGMAGIAMVGVKALAGIDSADLLPLLDEMFQCVQICPDPVKYPAVTRPLIEDDIEEVLTRLRLRAEIFTLHTGFFIPGFPSKAAPGKPLF